VHKSSEHMRFEKRQKTNKKKELDAEDEGLSLLPN
jgi:hypothetical protein